MSFDISRFLEDMSTEPYVLLAGEKFDYKSEAGRRIMDLPWSCVVTSIREDDFAIGFDKESRLSRDLMDISQLQQRIFEKRNLSIVRLFSTVTQEPHLSIGRKEQVKAFALLQKIAEMMDVSGVFVAVGYEQDDLLSFDKFLDLCESFRSDGIIIFGYSAAHYPEELKNIFIGREPQLVSENLVDLLPAIPVEAEEYIDEDSHYERVYVNQKIVSFERKALLSIKRVAIPLSIEAINEIVVPPYLVANYFYRFLKESPFQPQWYGYANQFNIKRKFEKKLYDETMKALESPGKKDARPICLAGQSGSGKSIALAYLAYRVFTEKKYPVIYIQNRDVSFVFYDNRASEDSVMNGFDAIGNYIEQLKLNKAKSVLLILDVSVANRKDREKCLRLFGFLTNIRGYNVQLVFSSYEIEQSEIDRNVFNNISSDVFIDAETEENQLRTVLKRKAKFSPDEIEAITAAIYKKTGYDKNLMSLLYRIFFEVRPSMELGIQREATTTIKAIIDNLRDFGNESIFHNSIAEAFKKAYDELGKEIDISDDEQTSIISEDDIKRLLTSVAICTENSLPMPSDMVYRLIPSTDYRVIKRVCMVPFFVFREKETDGSYEVWIRTQLEAQMLRRAYNIDSEASIDIIVNIIENLRSPASYSYNAEVDLVARLLHNIGPNSGDRRKRDEYKQPEFYKKIIIALGRFRETYGGNPRLTLQEIVYMREAVALQNCEDDSAEKGRQLSKAIKIGEREIDKIGQDNNQRLRDMLIIEVNNSRLRLNTGKALKLADCQEIQRSCAHVIRHDPANSYAYTAMIRAALLEFNALGDEEAKAQILSQYCDVIDQIRGEHPEIATQEELLDVSVELYNKMNDVTVNEQYFQNLLERGSDAGIHLQAKQILQKAGIDLYKKSETALTDDQIKVCRQVCADILENEQYSHITTQSERCQQMLLRVKWLIFNREPIFCGEKSYTYIPEQGWRELMAICSNYKNAIYDDEADYYRANTMLYILALCHVQLGQFEEAFSIISLIRGKTETLYFEDRIRVKHILCNEIGKPLTFGGKFASQTQPDEIKGYVLLDKVTNMGSYGRYGIYYHQANMRNTIRAAGQRYTDFQLGLGFMGLSVFRGLINPRLGKESHDYEH